MSEGTFPDYGVKINFKDYNNTIATNLDMTTEEKAKRYDEALNWMRELYPGLHGATKEDAEHYFPELKESEDERIRKFICSIIDNLEPKDFVGVKKMNVLAWLEKQREQKTVIVKPHNGDDNNPYDMGASEAQDYIIKRGFTIPFNDGEVYVDERHIIQTIGNILRWADEHPKEQKPITINQDEKEFLADEIAAFLCNYDKEFDGEDPVPSEIAEHFYLLGKQAQEQKQTDEQFPPLEGLDAIKAKYYDDGFKNGFDEGVESVKPLEWSEEDEKMRKNIICLLEVHPSYRKEEDWLKSLQPQAKQEQKPLEYLPKEKVYDIMFKLTNLSFSKLIPFNSEEYKKINEITSDVYDLLKYPIEKKENLKSSDSIPPDCVINAKCEDRWRKVEESLPDNGRLVLAKDSIGNILLARYDGENWEVDVYDNEDYYCRNFITKWCEIPFEVQKEQTNMDLTQQKNEAKL